MKNVAGQISSPLRTITCGRYACDSSGARRLHLPPSAYCREDRQSDHLVALLFNPYFLVVSPDTCHIPDWGHVDTGKTYIILYCNILYYVILLILFCYIL